MRNRTVDEAKGSAGVFVVLGHTLAFRYQEGALLLLTHLTTPLYLFLSGVFIKVDRPWRQAVMRLLDALLKPYFVVLVAWGAWHAFYGNFDWSYYLAGLLYGTGSTIVLVPLWFLPHIFLCCIVARILLKDVRCAEKPKICVLLVIAFLMVGLYTIDWVWRQPLPVGDVWRYWFAATTHWPGLPFSADVLPITVACLLAGYVLSECVQHCRFYLVPWAVAVLVVIAIIYGGAFFDINRRMVKQPVGVAVLMAAGLYVAIVGAAGLARWKLTADLFSYLGRYFLLVLLLHLLVLRWIYRVLEAWLPNSGDWQTVCMFVIGMVFSLALVEVVRRSRILSLLLLPLPR
ncbi:MAG: acyltransferase family protein [Pseudomonadales bacterium]|nr:acyltransferase family protein [Pseudomonadales bacterium]